MTDQPPADRDAEVDPTATDSLTDGDGLRDGTERQPGTDGPNLGKDGTIPNSDTGIAVGHDPDGSNFNPEEDPDPEAETA